MQNNWFSSTAEPPRCSTSSSRGPTRCQTSGESCGYGSPTSRRRISPPPDSELRVSPETPCPCSSMITPDGSVVSVPDTNGAEGDPARQSHFSATPPGRGLPAPPSQRPAYSIEEVRDHPSWGCGRPA